ncbi:MAG TPA: polysaccharide deacetylase family protein [Virgibacillus sp.]|nr:polysaccharide deacetylase family protein [Virgibacillus sp.]
MQLLNRAFTVIFMMTFITTLIACQQQGTQHEDQSPRVEPTLDHPDNRPDQLEQDNDKFNMGSPHEQPQLAGGSERDVREPHPVSNDQLQKKYPGTLILHASRDKNQVALSFDDGPDIRFTPMVLDVLDKHDVKATFFMMGSRAKEHRDIVERVNDAGHVIGNHTYWHPNLPKEELDRLDWEVKETEKVIEDIVGYKPRLFRSPYGALNEEMVEKLAAMDNKIIGWDVDSIDWKQPGADVVADNVLSNVSPGSIILMHDGGDWTMDLSGTAEGLDRIITKLKEDGIEFVTIPELIGVQKEK